MTSLSLDKKFEITETISFYVQKIEDNLTSRNYSRSICFFIFWCYCRVFL